MQNIFLRTRYQEVLQSLHFVDNIKKDKTDKAKSEQSVDKHMTKFK